MVRDLHFAWEETAQQQLDEQQQKVRASLRAALIGWASADGRRERLPRQSPDAMFTSCRPLVRDSEYVPQTERSLDCSKSTPISNI